MKNILNQKLLKTLITTDFLLETVKSSSKNIWRYQNSKILIPFKKDMFIYSDPFETIKDLKQISRLIHFCGQNPKKNQKILDFFFSSDGNSVNFELLISEILKRSRILNFNINLHLKNSNSYNSKGQIAIILNDLQNCNTNLIKNRLNHKCYLFLKLNSNLNDSFSEYILRKNLCDMKKTLFFFTFLNQLVLSKKTCHNSNAL